MVSHKKDDTKKSSASATSSTSSSTITSTKDTTKQNPALLPAKAGDIDGDGIADKFVRNVTALQSTSPGYDWGHQSYVVTLSSTGGSKTIKAKDGLKSTAFPIALSTDIDRDGHAEVLLLTDGGERYATYWMVKVVDGAIAVVKVDGKPLEVTKWGSTYSWSNFSCSRNDGSIIDEAFDAQPGGDSGKDYASGSYAVSTFTVNGATATVSKTVKDFDTFSLSDGGDASKPIDSINALTCGTKIS